MIALVARVGGVEAVNDDFVATDDVAATGVNVAVGVRAAVGVDCGLIFGVHGLFLFDVAAKDCGMELICDKRNLARL